MPKEKPEPAAARLHDKHLARGRALMKQKKYQAAIHEFASALEAWPDEPQALYELGRSAFLDGDNDSAESALKGALDAADDDETRAAIKFAQAQVADKRGHKAAAVKMADESLALHPDEEVRKWRAEHATSK